MFGRESGSIRIPSINGTKPKTIRQQRVNGSNSEPVCRSVRLDLQFVVIGRPEGLTSIFRYIIEKIGGRTRTRTVDPLIKSQLLYQLSYAPAQKAEVCGG
jgi:hypothetical protein